MVVRVFFQVTGTYIQRTFGEFQRISHEVGSVVRHIDIAVIEPTPDQNWYTLVTIGMSARPMSTPEKLRGDKLECVELIMLLPPTGMWNLKKIIELGPGHSINEERPINKAVMPI